MNWRLTKQSDRTNLHEVNASEVDGTEAKTRKNGGNNEKILAEMRAIKSDLESLKKQTVNEPFNSNQEYPTGGRKSGKSTRFRGKGCQACKDRGVGSSCQHCYACGNFGHIASNCAKNLKIQGNEYRHPRRRDRE